MASARPAFVFRASRAFSSLAVTVALAVLTILALAVGSMRDSKAEVTSPSLLGLAKVEDPSFEWSTSVEAGSLPDRDVADSKPQVISRKPLSSARKSPNAQRGPAQEWMGMSKIAFPLLVNDLVAGRTLEAPTVMTGRTVGTK